MFNKNTAYRCIKSVPSQPGVEERGIGHEGEVVLCTKGGEKPILTNGTMQLSASETALARHFEKASSRELPEALQPHCEVKGELGTLKKGDIVQVVADIVFPDGERISAGTLLRCGRGGKSPQFIARSDDSLHKLLTIQAPLSHFARHEAVISPGLENVSVRIKTFEEMSQETLAKRGAISLGKSKVHVHNDDHGADDLISGDVDTLREALAVSLSRDPVTPYKDEPEAMEALRQCWDRAHGLSVYVEYSLSAYWAVATFGDYFMRSQAKWEELVAEMGDPTKKH